MAATVRSDILVRIGAFPSKATAVNPAIDTPQPYIGWTLPSDITQVRFNLKITATQSESSTVFDSSVVTSASRDYYFPSGSQLSNEFAGLCKVEVYVSENTNGAMEFVSSPLYFVFDPQMERLILAEQVRLSWTAPVDPDSLPVANDPAYEIEISESITFTSLVYHQAGVTITGGLAKLTIPSVQFNPIENTDGTERKYFWRVRGSDGADYGDWSRTNAFVNLSVNAPVVSIVSVTPLNNTDGDVLITFSLESESGLPMSVEFTYSRDGMGSPAVCRLINSPVHLPSGTHQVVWRTLRSEGRSLLRNVTVYALAFDGTHYSGQARSITRDIDNSALADPGGGIGSIVWVYPVSGYLQSVSHTAANDYNTVQLPVSGYRGPSPVATTSEQLPVTHRGFFYANTCVLGPAEKGFHRTNGPNFFSPVVTSITFDNDPLRFNPHTESSRFLFRSPVDLEQSTDGWPRPFNSREMSVKQYLRGYTDADGVVRDYPNGYDWANRPSWHLGREVWDSDDGWVQLASYRWTDLETCSTCGGKGWVVGLGPPITRQPCPNANCDDGLDTSRGNNTDAHTGAGVWEGRVYYDAVWYRLSSLLMARPFGSNERYGLPINSGYGQAKSVYVAGRQPSTTEVTAHLDTILDNDGNEVLWTGDNSVLMQGITYHHNGQDIKVPLRLSANTQIPHVISGTTSKHVTRDPNGGGLVSGSIWVDATSAIQDYAADQLPVGGKIQHQEAVDAINLPVGGNLGPSRDLFFFGSTPDTPGHLLRARPTQVGVPRVSGRLGRPQFVKPLAFRFTPGYWDAFNTLHWQMTGSETSYIHMQWAEVNNDGTRGQWQDTQGENASLDQETGQWLVSPLMFHMYLDTVNRSLFQNEHNFQLRIRQFDKLTRTYTEWVYSRIFKIVDGVANPVSVLAMEYEPWSKTVDLTCRVDSSVGDYYTLTKFFYSRDDGASWVEISKGDIGGETTYLTTARQFGQNIFHIQWDTSSYQIGPGDSYRVKIEAVPSDVNDTIEIPFFKWVSPNNPALDAAQLHMADMIGTWSRNVWNEETQSFSVRPDPVFIPGQLDLLDREYQRVLGDPSPDGVWAYAIPSPSGTMYRPYTVAPSGDIPDGWYSLVDVGSLDPSVPHVVQTRWQISDQTGYRSWQAATYQGHETHADAMRRISSQIASITGYEVPTTRRLILDCEKDCRRDLIDQGYYAEDHFITSDGNIEEMVQATPEMFGTEDPHPVHRYWRFYVQSVPDGPDNIYDDNGNFDPQDITPLEQVYYRFQMDSRSDFDTKPHAEPLRDIIFNRDGQRLSVATLTTPTVTPSVNEAISSPQGQDNIPSGISAGSGGFGVSQGSTGATANSTIFQGGELKLGPEQLPGEVLGDVLASGQTDYQGQYLWRVRAYNAIAAAVQPKPRPLITSYAVNDGSMVISYLSRAHKDVHQASLRTSVDDTTSSVLVDGYMVSNSSTTPVWEDLTALDFVSDNRAHGDSATTGINPPWVPSGKDRPHPWIGYDNDLMQYVVFNSKKSYDGRWRPIGSRMMAYPKACEYDVYFVDHPAFAIFAPSLVKVASTWWMYVTVIDASGDQPYLAAATSNDLHNWSNLIPLGGVPVGANPTVAVRNGVFHLWYELNSSGVKTYYATSTDGLSFDVQNAAQPVINGSSPGVVWFGGQWNMAFVQGAYIRSAISADGITWGNFRDEMTTSSVDDDGTQVLATPMHPSLFVDTYMGNEELFMAFSYVLQSGASRVWVGRREDRVWVDGVPNGLHGDTSAIADVIFSRDGISRTLTADMAGNSMNSSSKVRLIFENQSPTTIEFKRQSRWVTPPFDDADTEMEPYPWTFNKQLLFVPYII